MQKNPLFSIVIPAHDEEQYIEKTVGSIKQQEYGNIEVIVVPNGCTDKTADIAAKHADKVYVLQQRSVSEARNTGARHALGDIILFLDADTRLEKDAVQKLVQCFENENISLASCKVKPNSPKLHYRIFCFLKNAYYSLFYSGSNGALACKKEILQHCRFNESMQLGEIRDFIAQAKKHGKYRFLRNTSVTTSMRRYEKLGFLRTLLFWAGNEVKRNIKGIGNKEYEVVR